MNAKDHSLLDLVECPVFILEPNHAGQPVYVAFNAAARSVANFNEESVIGKTAASVYPGHFGIAAYKRHCEALESGTTITYEIALPFATKMHWVRTHLQPEIDEQGTVLRLVGTSNDITSEYGLRQIKADSVVLNNELENFISLAAHDLRGPVRNMKLLTDMLREECEGLGDGPGELIDKLENVAGKAMTMINDVLSHAEATGVTETAEDFDLPDLCHEIMQSVDPQGKTAITVQPVRIYGDRIATHVVLRNLIENAIKHNPGVSVALNIAATSPDNHHFEVLIADNGVGFPDPTIAFLDGGGFRHEYGFGLLGVRKLVDARKGNISADNLAAGKGARVRLRLPGRIILPEMEGTVSTQTQLA